LTAALALRRNGFRVVVLEQAQRLEETGAGIQLSPNASRLLIELGLEERLRAVAVEPTALRVLNAANGREIVRMPLSGAALHYGAPYWMIHRGDLQEALTEAAARDVDVNIRLGVRVEDFEAHANGLSISTRGGVVTEPCMALLAADGLWSTLRKCLGHREPPRFTGRIAWRGLVPARDVTPQFREPVVHLWLGRDAHLVHYPVKAGAVINVVVITADAGKDANPTAQPSADAIPPLAADAWAMPARALVGRCENWLQWGLYDRRPIWRWSQGPVALLGDAAHPMLPFLAQGAAMAIEDAAVAARCLARTPDDPAGALRTYCAIRRGRARRVQRAATRNGARYHMSGAGAFARDTFMRAAGGERLLQNYNWIYDWRPPAI
jgi:salicylate hydroxylase